VCLARIPTYDSFSLIVQQKVAVFTQLSQINGLKLTPRIALSARSYFYFHLSLNNCVTCLSFTTLGGLAMGEPYVPVLPPGRGFQFLSFSTQSKVQYFITLLF